MKEQLLMETVAAVLITGLADGYEILGSKGTTGADNEPEVTLCYDEVNPEGHVLTDSTQYFADRVSELTDGGVMVEVYPSGQLGDGARCCQSMKMGVLDLYRDDSMSLANNGNPVMPTLAPPYIFRDRDHFQKACDSDLDRETLDNIQDCIGMISLTYLGEGARNFFTTDRPVRRLEDMRGLKIRVRMASMMGGAVEALGAEAVSITYAELYTALESGTIGRAENPPVSCYYNKFYRVAPYCVGDRHVYTPEVILVSKITWKNLKEEYQNTLVQATMGTQEYNRTAIEETNRRTYEALEKEGVTILESGDPQTWIRVTRPVYRKCGGKYLDLIERIRQIQQTHTL